MNEKQALTTPDASSPPFLSWCLVVRNCEKTLRATLTSIKERTPGAEIVVVDTCSNDGTPEIAKEFADVFATYRGPRGDWSADMAWADDMASARQHAFELASGKWRGWIDGDDRLAGPEEAKALLSVNDRYHKQLPDQKHSDDLDPDATMGLEEIIKSFDENRPDVTCFWAPYLYQRDEHGQAITWQTRERIVRWDDGAWEWAEAAHEILVPRGGHYPPRVQLAGLLFVHEKDFSDAAYEYSMRRHYAVLESQYQEGDITTRRALYLANYAKFICPERELEYIDAAHLSATSTHDRWRALTDRAVYWAARGMYMDAWENFNAAVMTMPTLPDAWCVGGEIAAGADETDRAVEWLTQGCALEVSDLSMMNPRHLAVRYPALLCEQLIKLARKKLEGGDLEGATRRFKEAEHTARAIVESEAVGHDIREAEVRHLRIANEMKGHEQAMLMRDLWQYLRDNDEPAKAVELLEAVPHTIEDHPVVTYMQIQNRTIETHIDDPIAYDAFYQDEIITGYASSPLAWLEPANAISRVHWMADWINTNMPNARVLEVGCFDGILGIPLVKLCKGIEYTGVDIGELAISEFTQRRDTILDDDVAGRIKLFRGELDDIDKGAEWSRTAGDPTGGDPYDVIIYAELIEHVPDPVSSLELLGSILSRDGVLLVTTPWGSFDDGHPPDTTFSGEARDPRGHLRAMNISDMVDAADDADFDVVQCHREWHVAVRGDSMHAALLHKKIATHRPVSFAVYGALWDWNGSKVHADGIGASEETIVYLGEQLARTRGVEVYGPVPEEEVHNGVSYWRRQKARWLENHGDGTIVVSRAPGYGRRIKDIAGRDDLRMVLWLQDTHYDDLNAETAADYEHVVGVSEWHGRLLAEQGVPREKIEVAYNFLLPEHFTGLESLKRDPHHFIYASSPDRGLIKLLELWPFVLDAYPDATLDIFYGWRGCNRLGSGADTVWAKRFLETRRRYDELKFQSGIRERGLVNHLELALEFRRSAVWCYPTDFHETGCLTACKARAAGAVPVTTALAALEETAACEIGTLVAPSDPHYDAEILSGIHRAIDASEQERALMSEESIELYGLPTIMKIWDRIL